MVNFDSTIDQVVRTQALFQNADFEQVEAETRFSMFSHLSIICLSLSLTAIRVIPVTYTRNRKHFWCFQ